MRDLNTFPKGSVWLTIKNLPPDTVEENLTEFLRDAGLDIIAQHVSVMPSKLAHRNTAAIIAIPKAEIARLVTWLLSDKLLGGQTLVAVVPGARP